MLKKSILTLSSLCIGIISLVGQNRLAETFYQYEVLEIDSRSERAKSEAGFFETTVRVPSRGIEWVLDLHQSQIIADNYKVRYVEGSEIKERVGTTAIPAQGFVKGMPESRVSLTFNDDFVYGFIMVDDVHYYIEPLSYFANTGKSDQFVFYSQDDLKPTAEKTCGINMEKHANHRQTSDIKQSGERVGECFEVEYAIANDFSMFQSYGSIAGVENHAIGVTNNVQTNYDDEFADELQLIIVEQFVVSTNGGDPWTSSTSAGALLDSFTDWGPSGFSTTHDMGSIWTNRNFDGTTIGIAWLGVICNNFRYNALEDFSNNAEIKRVMVAHEIGHNFDASHDGSGSGTIMAPSVNVTNTWSNASVNSINSHVASRFCLSSCATTALPPQAGFSSQQIGDCAAVEVNFTDQSLGSNLSYNWTFPGGSPTSSSDPNPTVFYFDQGIFDVSLTVSNSAGSSTDNQLELVDVNDIPDPAYFFDADGLTVTFDNITLNANSFSWDFGDGVISTEASPVHTYNQDDTYFVVFTATNDCGTNEISQLITIATPPVPAFSNSQETGCAEFTVNFFNESSSNVSDLQWEFPGGEPAISAEANPTVTYSFPGVYDVTLVVTNSQGVETLVKPDLITVLPATEADFSFILTGSTIECNNLSSNADSYLWDFGDGTTSEFEDPFHTYTEDGTYTITLTATGECGTAVHTETVTISLSPMAVFSTVQGITSGCSPFTVEFLNSSNNNPTSFLWTFEGGNPATSTAVMPTVIYDSPGSFDVQLIAISSLGSDTMTVENYINVQLGPTADPTYTSEGRMIDFMANATSVTFFNWDFGDGTVDTGIDPTHTYAADGTYTVTLIAGNDCGQVTTTFEVDAYAQSVASFTAAPTTLCEGEAVQFNSSGSMNASSYFWSFEGGTPATSTDANPLVTFASSGVFDVSLSVSNLGNADEITMSDLIAVEGDLVTSFSAVPTGLTVSFTNATIGASGYMWNFGDGATSAEENPTHTFATEDSYTVTLTATNSCGMFTASEELNLFSQVTAGFVASREAGCAALEVSFSDMSSDNTTAWAWSFPGGTPAESIIQNPTVTYSVAGTYTATLVASNPAGEASVSTSIVVTDVADASFDLTRNQLSISLTNTSVGGDTYSWDFGDGNSSIEENPSHLFESEGTYTVTLSVTNECGTTTASQDVTANALPTAGFTVSGGLTTGCIPFEVLFTDASSTNVESRVWTFEGGSPATSTEINPTVVYNEVGTYDVSLTVTAQAGTDVTTSTDLITVGDVPVADFDAAVDELSASFTYTGGAYTTILWNFGDGRTSTEKDPTNEYEADGTYTVTVTVSNDCGSTTAEEDILVTVTAVEESELLKFEVFPNPASDHVTIATAAPASLSILDIAGRVVMTEQVKNGQSLSTAGLAEGTYIIQMRNDKNHIAYKKLVIVK